MRKFSEVLEEYLTERDRQNSDYYDNRFMDARYNGRLLLEDLAKELDEMVQGIKE
jgi:predicted CopG family antitoxin